MSRVLLAFLALAAVGCEAEEKLLNRQVRIVNGVEARSGVFPYVASVQSSHRHFCGGSFISPNWVITAGHCFKHNRSIEKITVRGGSEDLDSKDTFELKAFKVVRFGYNTDTKRDDLALLYVDSSPHAGKFETIEMNPTDFDPTDKNCTVAGWGLPKHKGRMVSNKLHKIDIVVHGPDKCQEMYDNRTKIFSKDHMVCAGGNSRDACQGDSGGPLVCPDDKTDKKYLVGLVSWGIGCATKDVPGCYTNIKAYKTKIEKAITDAEAEMKAEANAAENVRKTEPQKVKKTEPQPPSLLE